MEGMTSLAYPLTQANGVDHLPGKLTVFCLPKQRAQLALGDQFCDLLRSVAAVFCDLPRSHYPFELHMYATASVYVLQRGVWAEGDGATIQCVEWGGAG